MPLKRLSAWLAWSCAVGGALAGALSVP